MGSSKKIKIKLNLNLETKKKSWNYKNFPTQIISQEVNTVPGLICMVNALKPYFFELKIQQNFFILSYLLVDKKTVTYLLQEMFLPASS
jgi:hypothetical protein